MIKDKYELLDYLVDQFVNNHRNGISLSEISNNTHTYVSYLSNYMRELEDDGLVELVQRGEKGYTGVIAKYPVWFLTQTAIEGVQQNPKI